MTAAQPRVRLVTAGWGLAILALINLFNYLDRYVVAALYESLRHSTLALSDSQLGSLMSAFLVVYMCAAPVFGALGDRRGRPALIALGVACWSLATGLSGLAGSFLALLAARAVVGIGEAAYGTIAPSLLSDYYPADRRGRVMAIFFCAIPVGSALGYVIGGIVDAHFGWRTAFFVAGAPGLALAALCLLLPDPPRGQQDELPAPQSPPLRAAQPLPAPAASPSLFASTRATYRRLLGNRPYVLTVLGYAAYTFAVGGLGAWMPAFLERVRGMPKAQATVSFGAIVVITGFLGTFAGGWLGDFCTRYSRQAFLWLCGISVLLAAPFVWAALTTRDPAAWTVYMVIAQFLIFLSTGPINAAIVNMVSPLERASAIALSVFAIHILGDAVSPVLIGAVSDATSLGEAVKILPCAVLVSGVVWCLAARAQRVPAR
jgi:MFS transporter, Spinster family, sphingosine-1-phosphate transporter